MQQPLVLRAFFDALDGVPLREHCVGGGRAGLAKHMRMAADELLGESVRHLVEIKGSGLAGDLGVQHGLQQDVAEFIANLRGIAATDGLGHLVGLLNDMRDQRLMRLLHVPRTAAGRAQAMNDVAQAGEGVGMIEQVFHAGS